MAYRLWQEHRKPRIVFYRCLRPLDPVHLDGEQYKHVQKFFEEFDARGGAHPGFYQTFLEPEDFKDRVRDHLETYLLDTYPTRLSATASGPSQISPITDGKSPTAKAEFRNPFIVGQPVTDPADFYGRESEIRFALARLEGCQSVSIFGERRIGKTSLLHHLLFRARERWGKNCRTAYIDLLHPAARTPEGLFYEIQKRLGLDDAATDLVGFTRCLEDLAKQGQRCLVALDKVDSFIRWPAEFVQNFFETLRALASDSANRLSLLTASRVRLSELYEKREMTSPLYNIMGSRELGLFTDAEARGFVAEPRPGVQFTPAQVEAILERGQRHPLRLQILCWHAAEAVHEGRAIDDGVSRAAQTEIEGMLG